MTLKGLNQEIAATYGLIAKKVEELLALVNETESEEREVKKKTEAILKFLSRFKKSVVSEKEIAKKTIKETDPFLVSLQNLLVKIGSLKVYIKLASKKVRGSRVIKGIAITNSSILAELDNEKKML